MKHAPTSCPTVSSGMQRTPTFKEPPQGKAKLTATPPPPPPPQQRTNEVEEEGEDLPSPPTPHPDEVRKANEAKAKAT